MGKKGKGRVRACCFGIQSRGREGAAVVFPYKFRVDTRRERVGACMARSSLCDVMLTGERTDVRATKNTVRAVKKCSYFWVRNRGTFLFSPSELGWFFGFRVGGRVDGILPGEEEEEGGRRKKREEK